MCIHYIFKYTFIYLNKENVRFIAGRYFFYILLVGKSFLDNIYATFFEKYEQCT